jgi:hypothetical protein
VELPHAEKLYRELKSQGFALLTVTSDPAPEVLKMVEHHGITHPIVSDSKDPATGLVFEKYHAYDGKHYLIGSNGKILAVFSKLGVSIPILRRELARHGIGSADGPAVMSPTPAAAPQDGGLPVVWKATPAASSLRAGGTVRVTLSVAIATGWHIYAMTQGPGGPTPLGIEVPKGQPFTLAGKIQAPPPDVTFDQNFRIDVAQHEGSARFVLPVAVAPSAAAGKTSMSVSARYQACNASICLPPETVTLRVPVTIAK